MLKWMNDCILEAPKACEDVIKNRNDLLKELVELFLLKPYKKIVLVAAGSSFNIANCARYAMEEFLDIEVECIHSKTYARYDYKYHDNSFIMCLSQSGRSTNTIEAIKVAKENGNDVAALTMIPGSPVTNHAEHTFVYGTSKYGRDLFVCRGVPSSTLFLMLFALEAAYKGGKCDEKRYKQNIKQLEDVVKEMPRIQKKVLDFYTVNKEDFYSMRRVMIVGIGPSLGVALEGSLKLEETVGIPANAYESEEFIHGPTYEIKKDNAVFLLDMDDVMHDRIIAVYRGVQQLTDRAYLITKNANYADDHTLNIDVDCDPNFLPLLFVIPFQYIPSNICEELGIRAITIYNHRSSEALKTKTDN